MKHISAMNIFIAGLLLAYTTGLAAETNQMNEGKEIMKDNKISLGAEIKLMAPVWVIGSYDKAGEANMRPRPGSESAVPSRLAFQLHSGRLPIPIPTLWNGKPLR